jgi:DNA-directed RNA polymerase subunit alpha
MQINSFRMEDGKLIWDTLEKHLPTDLPKNMFSL